MLAIQLGIGYSVRSFYLFALYLRYYSLRISVFPSFIDFFTISFFCNVLLNDHLSIYIYYCISSFIDFSFRLSYQARSTVVP